MYDSHINRNPLPPWLLKDKAKTEMVKEPGKETRLKTISPATYYQLSNFKIIDMSTDKETNQPAVKDSDVVDYVDPSESDAQSGGSSKTWIWIVLGVVLSLVSVAVLVMIGFRIFNKKGYNPPSGKYLANLG